LCEKKRFSTYYIILQINGVSPHNIMKDECKTQGFMHHPLPAKTIFFLY
jgi:hypothetical protein